MSFFILATLVVGMVAGTAADDPRLNLKAIVKELPLNTEIAPHRVDAASIHYETITNTTVSDLVRSPREKAKRGGGIARRWIVDDQRCLPPVNAAQPDDCRAICDEIGRRTTERIVVQPLQILGWEYNTCVFEVGSLDACTGLVIPVLSNLKGICDNMLMECVQNGYDGYVAGHDPNSGFDLSGLEAAPPYEQRPCPP